MEEDIRALLANIWSILGQTELSDTREYITYIAALLTESRFPFSTELKPQRPVTTRNIDEAKLQKYLDQISAIIARRHAEEPSSTQILDRYVLFYASAFAQKDAYPIPRHIIDFMLTLLNIQPEHSFADFTCGAGGFLVNSNRGTGKWPKRIVGVEISPDWACIAAANATLHNLGPPQIKIIADDAFHACGPKGDLQEEQFNRIAMAPSFGRSIDKSLAQEVLGISNVRASEVLFTYLAQKKLESGGRAIVMVPASLLTNRTGTALRQKLVNERLLEAVITLKAGMLQPFNNEHVALLLIQQPKLDQPPLEQCWFLNLEHDGYPLNPGRDLLAPPPFPENDFSMAEMVLLPERDFQPIINGYERQEGTLLKTILEEQRDAKSPVVIIRVRSDTTLAELRHFAAQKDSQLEHYLLTQMLQGDQIHSLELPLQTREGKVQPASFVADTAAWRRSLYGLTEEDHAEDDLPSGDLLFGRATAGQMFAITRGGRLLGFSVPFTSLSVDTYSLVANHYLPLAKEPAVVTTVERIEKSTTIAKAADEVAQLLQELRRDLQQVEQQINNLQERLVLPNVIEKPLPSLIHSPRQSIITSYLGTEQQIHWQELRMRIEVTLPGKDMYALPFTPEELEIPNLSQAGMYQMLQILESLGLLIQVSSSSSEQPERNAYEQEKEQPRTAFRRITNRDIRSPKEHPWK